MYSVEKSFEVFFHFFHNEVPYIFCCKEAGEGIFMNFGLKYPKVKYIVNIIKSQHKFQNQFYKIKVVHLKKL